MYTLAMIFVTFVVAGVGGFLMARNIYKNCYMSEKEADKLLDEILELFEEADIEINTKMTLFAKVQNVIYEWHSRHDNDEDG